MTSDEIITVTEAAEILSITIDGVLKAIGRGVIKAEKFGARIYVVSKNSVIEYRDTRGPGPGRPRSEKNNDG